MISTLPRRHQLLIWVVGLLACVGAGAWLAVMTPLPLVWHYGALLGLAAAPLVVRGYCRSLSTGGSPRPSRS